MVAVPLPARRELVAVMITIQGVTKVFSKNARPAVDDLTLEIRDGEVLGLVGLNGAGKTTTIRMASGITIPTSGKIAVDGFDVVEDKLKASARVGWIPEFPNFEPNARPLPLMEYFAGFYDIDASRVKDTIKERLEEVGLTPYLQRRLRTYSQGMKKRFSIAESLIGDPQNIMFDETLNGLDPGGVMFVRKMIFDLKAKGKAILLSSHILSEVQNIADRVAIISEGKLIKLLTRENMKSLGKEAIHIAIDNPDQKAQDLLSAYGKVTVSGADYTIADITVEREKYPEIPAMLVGNGYRIRGFSSTGVSLEEYFFSLVGGRI